MKRPLSFTPTGPGQSKLPPRRFSTLPAIDGHQVIDFDGRQVETCELSSEAEALASNLNDAAMGGPRLVAHRIERL